MHEPSVGREPRDAAALALVIALAAAPAIGLGVARFAYALVLPEMRTDLGWSWTEAGWTNTSNALGYLGGALLAARAIDAAGAERTVIGGVIACVLSLAACALLRDTASLNAARAVAGLGGGFAFVAGGVLAAGVASRCPDRASLLLGVFYAGPGFGIALSGVVVPAALALGGPGSWSTAWGLLAASTVPLGTLLGWALHADVGTARRSASRDPVGPMPLLIAGYALFGAGYIAYMTFMVAWVRDAGGDAVRQALFWILVGAGAMGAPWLWAGVLGRRRHGHAFALTCSVTALGAALPLVLSGPAALFVSGALFGCAFFAVVASTTAFVRRNCAEGSWGRAIGLLTVAFGLGQMIGPVAIGALNDLSGGLSTGLAASAVLLGLAAMIGAMQRDR